MKNSKLAALTSLFIILYIVLISTAFASPIEFTLVASSLMDIPEGHGTFTKFSPPYVNNGNVVFRAYGNDTQTGIYTKIGNTLKKAADCNTLIPQGHGTFVDFSSPEYPPKTNRFNANNFINYNLPAIRANRIIFAANGPDSQTGIYLFSNQNLSKIMDQTITDANGKSKFYYFANPYFVKDEIGFNARGKHHLQGIYITNGNQIKTLFSTATPIPQGQGRFITLWNPVFNQQGAIVFRGTGKHQIGIYSNIGNQNYLKCIANTSTVIPKGKGTFIDLGSPSIHGCYIVFRGLGKEQNGIYYYKNNALIRVADNHTSIPQGQGNFVNVLNPAIEGENIVFVGTGCNSQQGIYLYRKQKLTKIIDKNDLIADKKINKLEFTSTGLNQGRIAFLATFEDGSSGIYLTTLL